eukprot:543268_1
MVLDVCTTQFTKNLRLKTAKIKIKQLLSRTFYTPTMALNAVDSLIDDVSPPPEANKTSSKNIYSIGDVVRVNVMRKINTVTRLARIRALDVDNALLHMLNNDDPTDNDQKQENHIGVEYFNWKVHSNSPYNTDLITDGIINGVKIFDVKKRRLWRIHKTNKHRWFRRMDQIKI